MFLSVVILGRFTTETHAMALYISADTPPLLTPHPGTLPVESPEDPVLRAVFERIVTGVEDWEQLIVENTRGASNIVRDQLHASGWIWVKRRRILGVIPTTRLGLNDEDLVSCLADRVTEALRNAIVGLKADPRSLAVGMLLGQLPTVFSLEESSRHRQELREMAFAAVEPILGLHQAIQTYQEDLRIRNASAD
jgi:Golgi phosphoprotein 3 (GPP34)